MQALSRCTLHLQGYHLSSARRCLTRFSAFEQLCKPQDRRATCSMQSIAAHFIPPPAGLQSSTEATCRSFLSGLRFPRMLATLRGPVQQPQWGCTSSSRWASRSQTASEVLTCLLEPLGISESCVPKLGALQGTSAAALPCLKQSAGGQVRAQGHIRAQGHALHLRQARPCCSGSLQLQIRMLPRPCLQAQARWPGLLALCCGTCP